MNRKILLLYLFTAIASALQLNAQVFTRADSLHGGKRFARSCYDVTHYNLTVFPDGRTKTIQGKVIITFLVLQPSKQIQIDLFSQLAIDSILFKNQKVSFNREFGAVFINFSDKLKKCCYSITVFYHGKPPIAENPPWDGGVIWETDSLGNFWWAVACQGLGASSWWPVKDVLADEPDSMDINIIVPKGYQGISNGVLEKVIQKDKVDVYCWQVHYPINNYNVTFYIGKYNAIKTGFYMQNDSLLPLTYWVLDYHTEIAQTHFKQVMPMLKIFEYYLGSYPFPKDGYKLAEAPYAGMEHQSAIAYGNGYKNGYNGNLGYILNLPFDFIIIHESAHEYWGNAVSMSEIADMWIHEGFTTYTEALYVEYRFGRDTAKKYIWRWKYMVAGNEPLISNYGVNDEPTADIYYKGALMLHTLRLIVNDDNLWFGLLKAIQEEFRYQTINTKSLVEFINQYLGKNYTAFFDQYLRYTEIPVLEYEIVKQNGKTLLYFRLKSNVQDLAFTVKVKTDAGKWLNLHLSKNIQSVKLENAVNDLSLNPTLYIRLQKTDFEDI